MEPACIFCKIVAKVIPAYVVYEDDTVIAFLDIFPRTPGHVQVIPKKHVRWVWDISESGHFMEVVQKIARAQKKVFDTDFVVGLVAGEEVPHAHFWLVPRHPNDGHEATLKPNVIVALSKEEMQDITVRLRETLSFSR